MSYPKEIWRFDPPSQEMADAPVASLRHEGLSLQCQFDSAKVQIKFERVTAFCFTHFRACAKEHLDAYDKILEMDQSDWLSKVRSTLHSEPGQLRHFRLFVDEVGCYDVIAESVDTSTIDAI